jgi:hypothetical protein
MGPLAREGTATHSYDRSSLRDGEETGGHADSGAFGDRLMVPRSGTGRWWGVFLRDGEETGRQVRHGDRYSVDDAEARHGVKRGMGTGTPSELCDRSRTFFGWGASGTPLGRDFRGRWDPWVAVGEWGRWPVRGRPPTALIGHPSGMMRRQGGMWIVGRSGTGWWWGVFPRDAEATR